MKILKFFILFFFIISCNKGIFLSSINSPDNKISLNFTLDNGKPFYSINKGDKIIVSNSSLGLILKNGIDLTKGFKIKNQKQTSFKNNWNPLFGEFKTIENNYNQLSLDLINNETEINIEFRIYNDGVAFRYILPKQKSIQNYDLMDEITEFNLSSKDSAWWIPGFSYRRYEFLYANTGIDDISKKVYSDLVEDISYDSLGIDAAHTPLTIKKNNGIFISIHEANLVDYSSMTLSPKGKGSLEVELYPWSDGIKVKSDNPKD